MPLTCIVRTTDVVDFSMPFALMEDTYFTKDSGHLEEELSKISSHDHTSLKEENAAVFHLLEETTSSTMCSARMKTF